ncbi:hypothetical protein SGCZBJ_21370 [Caulobacter zeae]|uniref:MmcQ/YjbR family DNA-binding protein n=1 Tax=Caulobacter zeae TaxID=2055137 RepID=A0A2N5D4I7_9CAUL|nr:MmcQ/YjbR family DNA-binding protein [Caulobacter zeae]PLR20990.1 hypothetical protein SGCZBJ_21370 [Caulobacter zeae]
MTPEAFSALAARLGEGVQVQPVLDTVQFKVGGKAFATLGWPEAGWAIVKLTPRDQAAAMSLSDAVTPEPGRRRNSGVTLLRLERADAAVVASVLAAAFTHAYRGASVRRAAAAATVARGR